MVGANCRRNVTADAIGMAKVREDARERDVDGARIGLGTSTVRDTTMYPGSGLSVEITPLLLLVSSISMLTGTTITAACSTQGKVRAACAKLSHASLSSNGEE